MSLVTVDMKNEGRAADMIKFVLFHGILPVLDHFTEQLINAMRRQSISWLLVDANRTPPEMAEQIFRFHQEVKGRTIAVMFNNIYLPLFYEQESFWDVLQIPVYDILVDHPIYYRDNLIRPFRQLHVVLSDRDSVRFAEKMFPELSGVHFLPLGGSEYPGERKPYHQRETDVLYVGRCQDVRGYMEIPFLPDSGGAFYTEISERLIWHPESTTEEAVSGFISHCEQHFSYEEKLELFRMGVVSCEWNTRRVYKLEIMRRLGEAGISTIVYGGEWMDDEIEYPPNITISDKALSREEFIRMINDAKITLNISPWLKDGVNERVFDAMLNGSISVTDKTRYLTERFHHGKDIVFYELNNLPQLAENVRWLLDHPDEAALIAERGRETAHEYDTWESRLNALIEIINAQDQRING